MILVLTNPYSNIAINNITNSLEIIIIEILHKMYFKIKRFELENLIKFEITEIDQILDAMLNLI